MSSLELSPKEKSLKQSLAVKLLKQTGQLTLVDFSFSFFINFDKHSLQLSLSSTAWQLNLSEDTTFSSQFSHYLSF